MAPIRSVPGWRWLWALLVLLPALACVQTTATPTPTPTPTPVPTLTPTAAPSSNALKMVEFEADFDPTPNPEVLARLRRLLSHVPDDYPSAIFVDVEGLGQNAEVRATLELDDLGISGVLLPLISGSAHSVLITAPGSGGSSVVLLEGGITGDALLNLARGVGISFAAEPEVYNGRQVWNGDAFGLLSLSLAVAGDGVIVIAQDAPGASPGPDLLVKSALDTSDGTATSLVDNAELDSLLGQLPTGLITSVLEGCRQLENAQIVPVLVGCTQVGLSVVPAPEDKLIAHLLLGFSSAAEAEAALPVLRDAIVRGELRLNEVAIRQEATLVRIRAVGETSEVLAALEDVASR